MSNKIANFVYHKHTNHTHMFKNILTILFLVATLTSCDNTIYYRFNHIKSVGDTNPQLALRMLDSLELQTRNESEEVRMDYDMLDIRLKIKAGIVPTSDLKIKKLVEYFYKNGSEYDIQEVHYYAGCTYRDLHDTSRALEHFLKSLEIVQETRRKDTAIIHDTYSNIYSLYYNAHDYRNAYDTAKRELAFDKSTGRTNVTTVIHLADSYISLDSIHQARKCLNMALQTAHTYSGTERTKILYALLRAYSKLDDRQKADECYALLRKSDPRLTLSPDYNALGIYFRHVGDIDKTTWCYNMTAKTSKDEQDMLLATETLYRIHSDNGDVLAANNYAARYFKLSDSIELAKQKEMAAATGNGFQYHLERSRMEKAEYWKRIYMRLAIAVSLLVVAVVFTFYIFHSRYRNAVLRRQLKLANDMNDMRRRGDEMKRELEDKVLLLDRQKRELQSSEQELRDANDDIAHYTAELEKVRCTLEEKKQQSKSLMQMLHKTELSVKAEEVVLSVKEAANGKRKLDKDEWAALFTAVDNLYPGFRDKIIEHLGTFSEQQLQVCYLMRIGMDNPHIKNVTDIPRTTIWRWTKAYAGMF